jgi:hypothetical protein
MCRQHFIASVYIIQKVCLCINQVAQCSTLFINFTYQMYFVDYTRCYNSFYYDKIRNNWHRKKRRWEKIKLAIIATLILLAGFVFALPLSHPASSQTCPYSAAAQKSGSITCMPPNGYTLTNQGGPFNAHSTVVCSGGTRTITTTSTSPITHLPVTTTVVQPNSC